MLKCLLFLFRPNKSFSAMRETESSPENNLFNDGMKKESEGKLKIAPDQICAKRNTKVFSETRGAFGVGLLQGHSSNQI